jgi:uncharacterized protein YecE (DUF72 family)
MADIRIGISGWRYGPWRGAFYPSTLPQRLELWYAARIMSAIEINGSFYSLQRPQYYAEWYDQTPAGFVFAVKGPRFITHMKRLRDIETPLANFFASGVFNLREKLGPILWQFPPNLHYDRARFAHFLELLPKNTSAALRLARKRDYRLRGRSRLAIDAERPLRHAIEIRHESFLDPDFVKLLREYRVALVIAETARKWPLLEDLTSDFVYLRLHGDKELYRSGYGDAALDRWAQRIALWHRGREPGDAHRVSPHPSKRSRPRDVFCFFDNTDVKLRAPVDAQSLMRRLGLKPREPVAWEHHARSRSSHTDVRVGRAPRVGTTAQ